MKIQPLIYILHYPRIIDASEKIEQYEKFITDFSSFMFDFLYLGRQVYSFIPDEMQFRCGMNSYGEIEKESEDAVVKICDVNDYERIFHRSQTTSAFQFLN